MADDPVNGCQLSNLGDFPEYNTNGYLKKVSGFVSSNRHNVFTLQNPAGARWKIGHLQDTIYSEEDEEVEGWGKFYLQEAVSMEVIGVVEGVEGTSCPCEELVLMTCEDGQLYAYDGKELHLVASSVKQLENEGMEYPASKRYYDGEAFKDMTEMEWTAVDEKLDQEHREHVMSVKTEMLENLKSTRNNTRQWDSSNSIPPGSSQLPSTMDPPPTPATPLTILEKDINRPIKNPRKADRPDSVSPSTLKHDSHVPKKPRTTGLTVFSNC